MELPSYKEIVTHEAGNLINKAATTRNNGEIETWDEYSEVMDIYEHYLDAVEEGNQEAVYKTISNLKEYTDEETPERSRKYIDWAIDCLEAGVEYKKMLDNEQTQEHVKLDEVLKPFTYDEDIEIDNEYGDEEIQGSKVLSLVSNTFIKNWFDHGKGRKEGKKLWVTVDDEEDYFNIDVHDNGPGMDEITDQVFEPENSRESGLPSAKTITESLDGSISVYEPDTGGFGYNWRLKKK
ncbi:MAG: ATP-binding protein [Candidatus Nanohaloarchaea archaeon]